MKTISIVSGCYNEEGNVRELFERIKQVFASLGEDYAYEHIFIDNASTDGTVAVLKEMAAQDKRVKVIVNTRNFGQMRSPSHGIFQSRGRAVVGMCADFQDPPELLPEFVERWRGGAEIVLGVRQTEKSGRVFGLVVLDRSIPRHRNGQHRWERHRHRPRHLYRPFRFRAEFCRRQR